MVVVTINMLRIGRVCLSTWLNFKTQAQESLLIMLLLACYPPTAGGEKKKKKKRVKNAISKVYCKGQQSMESLVRFTV